MSTVTWSTLYRPRRLKDVCGQKQAVSIISGMLKNKKVPNALLFSGPSGVGKTTLARMLAMYLNCATGNACGKCPSCKSIDDHPDIIELNAAEARGIDDVRQLIAKANYKARYNTRVFILDEIQGMTPQSLQALLIPMESAPKNTIYCICTTDPQKLPTALLTRCSKINLTFPTQEETVGRLQTILQKEGRTLDEKVLSAVANASEGHVREAINILQSVLNGSSDDTDTEKLIAKIGSASSVPAVQVATKLLIALYANKPAVAVRAIFDVQDPLAVVNQCMWFNQFMLGTKSSASPGKNLWFSPQNKAFKALVEKHAPSIKVTDLLVIHRNLVKLRNTMHTVSTSEIQLMLAYLTETQ